MNRVVQACASTARHERDERARLFGIDGGGTKTRFALIDGDGHCWRRRSWAPPTIRKWGSTARPTLARGVAQVLQDAGIGRRRHRPRLLRPARLRRGQRAAAAPAGAARPDPRPRTLHLRQRHGLRVGRSLGCADGINIVAGTGSIGYGQRNGIGARRRLGRSVFRRRLRLLDRRRALNAYSRMSDGRAPGPLHAAFNEAPACARGPRHLRPRLRRTRSRAANSCGSLAVGGTAARRRRCRARAIPGPGRPRTGADRRRDPQLHCIFEPGERARLHLRRRLQRRRTVARFVPRRCTPPARHSHWCPAARTTLRRRTVRREARRHRFPHASRRQPWVAIGCFARSDAAGYRKAILRSARRGHRNRIRGRSHDFG